MCWVVFGVIVGSSNFPRRFHPKVFKGPSGFNGRTPGHSKVNFQEDASCVGMFGLCVLPPVAMRRRVMIKSICVLPPVTAINVLAAMPAMVVFRVES